MSQKDKKMKIKQKPLVNLTGKDGNVFNLIAICSTALKKENQYDLAKKMQDEIFAAGSYNEALAIMAKYCDIK